MSRHGTSDEGKDPINVHQDFQRAKRNALLWSSVCLLTAVGSPAKANFTAFHLPFVDVEFSSVLVVLILITVAVYMLLGFVRARSVLRILNNDFIVAQKVGNLVEALDIVRQRAIDATQVAANFDREVQHLTNAIISERKRFETFLSSTTLAGLAPENLLAPTPPQEELLTRSPNYAANLTPEWLAAQTDAHIRAISERGEQAWSQIKAGIFDHFERTDREVQNIVSQKSYDSPMQASLERLEDASRDLTRFSSALDLSSVRWNRWYDDIPVYALTSAAFGAATVRLVMIYVTIPAICKSQKGVCDIAAALFNIVAP